MRASPRSGCATATVPHNEVGSIDTVTGVQGGIHITGWSLDQTSSRSTYVWVDIDGSGMPVLAGQPLDWINAKYPGVGANHGIDVTVPAKMGTHRVCVTGTAEGVPLGCFSATVPSSGAASLDQVIGGAGSIRLTGWAVDRASTATMYIWVDIDGSGFPVAADQFLNWINAYFPGVGAYHGFDRTVPVSPGSHQVCVTLTFDNSSLGCHTVTVT